MSLNTTTDESGSHPFRVHFRYQAYGISFQDWVTILTLCLAPLIAHIIAGTPQPIHLHSSRPRWHDRIVHYNPTSIIWRYFAIVDRRVRAHSWTASDVAASNGLFWTASGWDGTQEMMTKCRDSFMQAPNSMVERLFSSDTLKTIIVALQGAQAIIYLTLGGTVIGPDTLFMPLATIGLLRLPAAPWLTDDHVIIDRDTSIELVSSAPQDGTREAGSSDTKLFHVRSADLEPRATTEYMSLTTAGTPLLRSTRSVRGITVRACYLLCIAGLLIIWVLQVFPSVFWHNQTNNNDFTLTVFLMIIFYGLWLSMSSIICGFYMFRGPSSASSTIIPCAPTTWYKTYTLAVMAAMVAMILVANLEARRMPCGFWTVEDSTYDREFCNILTGNKTAT